MRDLLEIARLEEARQAAGVAEVADEAEEVGGGTMCFGGKGSWCNQACGQGMAGPVEESELDRLVAFYVERGVEPKVELCPFADESVVRGLSRRGFTIREFENVFVCELDGDGGADAGFAGRWPSDLEFARVQDPHGELAESFLHIFNSSFIPEAHPNPETFARSARRLVEHPLCETMVALVGGRPAGAAAMEVRCGVAALFGGTVLPEFRRRGIQQAMILHRLERARRARARFACIHSRPGIATERNALRLGFQLAYTRAVVAMAGEGLESSP